MYNSVHLPLGYSFVSINCYDLKMSLFINCVPIKYIKEYFCSLITLLYARTSVDKFCKTFGIDTCDQNVERRYHGYFLTAYCQIYEHRLCTVSLPARVYFLAGRSWLRDLSCVSISACPSFKLSAYIHPYIYPSIQLPIHPSIHPSISPMPFAWLSSDICIASHTHAQTFSRLQAL